MNKLPNNKHTLLTIPIIISILVLSYVGLISAHFIRVATITPTVIEKPIIIIKECKDGTTINQFKD